MNLIKFQYEGSPIQFEEVNGTIMANATLMCQAFGKKPNDWQRLESTKNYISAVTRKTRIDENQLVTIKKGGAIGGTQGTWVHEKLVIELARWLNVDFAVWCDEKIAELLRTGKTEIERLSPAEIILRQAQQLVEHERRLDEIDSRVKKIEEKQIIVNHTIMGYSVIKRCRIDKRIAIELGKRATKICKDKGLETGLVEDEKYGQVRSYPKEALEQVFNEYLNIDKNH